MTDAGKDMGNTEPSTTTDGSANWYSNQGGGSLKKLEGDLPHDPGTLRFHYPFVSYVLGF